MLPEISLEQRGRVRAEFAEVFFLLMRRMRYGISSCAELEGADLLAAQHGTLAWKEEKDREEEMESESES